MEVVGGALDRRGAAVRQLDLECPLAGERGRLGGRLAHDRREVDRLARRPPAGVGAGEQQQVGHQAAHPARRAQRRPGDLALVAPQLGLQQLEVGQDARERSAQLVRGVGDEGALAQQRGLGLRARGPELAEHLLEGVRELGHLVAGRGLGEADAGRVPGSSHLARRPGEAGYRPHCAASDGEARQERERRAPQHAEGEEAAYAGDGVVQRALRLGVLHVAGDRLPDRWGERVEGARLLPAQRAEEERPGDDAVVVHVHHGGLDRRPEVGADRAPHELLPRVEDTDHGPAGPGDRVLGRGKHRLALLAHADLLLQVGRRGAQVVVEARVQPALGERAHDHREQQQDREREGGRDDGQLELDRQPLARPPDDRGRPHGSLST